MFKYSAAILLVFVVSCCLAQTPASKNTQGTLNYYLQLSVRGLSLWIIYMARNCKFVTAISVCDSNFVQKNKNKEKQCLTVVVAGGV